MTSRRCSVRFGLTSRSADLAICHVETPMSPRPPQGYPVFNTPPQLARAIRQTGWRICDTASNHSVDQGQYGIDQTGLALDRAGVLHTGSFSSPAAQARTLIVTVKGVKVAFLAYTEMTNGIPLPHPWSVNIARVDAVRHAARVARRRGAQVVIVNFHWGTEFQAAPSAFQLATARALTTDRDITAIVGQHAHVVQPISRVDGKLVVFGEGQVLSNQSAACCSVQTEDGMLVFLHITVDRRRVKARAHRVHADLGSPPRLHRAADRRCADTSRSARGVAPGLLRAHHVGGWSDPQPPRTPTQPPPLTGWSQCERRGSTGDRRRLHLGEPDRPGATTESGTAFRRHLSPRIQADGHRWPSGGRPGAWRSVWRPI